MDKEQVGRKAWLYNNDLGYPEIRLDVNHEHPIEAPKHITEGVFLTIQQRDDLIAESEARGRAEGNHG